MRANFLITTTVETNRTQQQRQDNNINVMTDSVVAFFSLFFYSKTKKA